MEVITKYIAKDGKEFMYENDCLEYERQLVFQDIIGECLFISSWGDKIYIDDIISEFDNVKYVFIKTNKAAEVLQDSLSSNYNTPWDNYGCIAGAWIFDDNYDCWKSLADLEDEVKQFRYYAPEWID